MSEQPALGFIRYSGRLVVDGIMDARRQAQALLGFDSALRFFIEERLPAAHDLEFEIPVQVREGSWEALIPATVAEWAQAGLGVAVTAYLAKAAQTLAQNDFKDVSTRDLFQRALQGIQWFAKIGKHIGDVTIRRFEAVVFSETGETIGIPNAKGEVLNVPKEYFYLYVKCPPRLLEPVVRNVEEGRELTLGAIVDGQMSEVRMSQAEKTIFCSDLETDDDVLFPDLVHGQRVELTGEVTRENKTANSMGFKYEGHVLTSYPVSGDIVPYKPLLFLPCRLYGYVDRIDDSGRAVARRPKLWFDRLEPTSMTSDTLFKHDA